MTLPPGQRERHDFPRFGLPWQVGKLPKPIDRVRIGGNVETPAWLTFERLAELPRVEQRGDFHCVTTWSVTGLLWGGYRFRDVYEQVLMDMRPQAEATLVVLRGSDGYETALPLEDAIANDVMLADTLNGELPRGANPMVGVSAC